METLTSEQETHLEEVAAIEQDAYQHKLKGEIAASLTLQRQAIALLETIVGPDSEYLAVDLDMLAINLYEAKQYDEAEALFRRAMAIYRKKSGEVSADVAASLQWLAYVHDDQRHWRKALQFLRASLWIQQAVHGPDYEGRAKSLFIYADLLRVTGRRVRASAVKSRAGRLRDRGR